MPRIRSLAAQPAPMRPVPAMPTVLTVLIGLLLLELQDVACFVGRRNFGTKQFDELDRLFDERAIRSIDALFEPKVVFKADADMAAEDDGLGEHRELVTANAEGGPDGILGQFSDLVRH